VPTAWTVFNTREYMGAVAFAYLCFLMFLAFSIALVVFQSAVSEELGIGSVQQPPPLPLQMAELPYNPSTDVLVYPPGYKAPPNGIGSCVIHTGHYNGQQQQQPQQQYSHQPQYNGQQQYSPGYSGQYNGQYNQQHQQPILQQNSMSMMGGLQSNAMGMGVGPHGTYH